MSVSAVALVIVVPTSLAAEFSTLNRKSYVGQAVIVRDVYALTDVKSILPTGVTEFFVPKVL
jgi:hypothetical protein